MRFLAALSALVFLSSSLHATEILPGFRTTAVAQISGFPSSIVTDSHGTIYCTTTDGWIHRVIEGQGVRIASLPTHSGGNGGLLGMVLLDDQTAVVHYTTWKENDLVVADVVSRVDLNSGAEMVLHTFYCDIDVPERGASPEHHGGNPTLGPNGSIFLGIGEYGGGTNAQRPGWNAGRIWRVDAQTGEAHQWALGLRNPYDLAWDPQLERIVVSDNGPNAGDELHVVADGENCGWPDTFGNQPPIEGRIAPLYVFPSTVAPTGLHRLRGAHPMLRDGYLLGAFVTRGVYYFPSVTATSAAEPVAIVKFVDDFVIDVTESSGGTIYFVTGNFSGGSTLHRIDAPQRGDCNGDGFVDGRDVVPMFLEVRDGDAHPMVRAQEGAHAGSWGCDANADGIIDEADYAKLLTLVSGRRRAVSH